ncbi:MAG: protease HtpX [Gammaproteobacteria bacterium]|nr:protease HtpX [Gammaproteobacteria bacterium]MYD76063.1 protease HtpX [Gammaproteobacteria bacterium]MYJ51233.1 protease HtpX [Gammaproteobacteria bacterium]
MKRVGYFLATNLAILAVLNVTARLLGFDQYLYRMGQNMGSLLVFAAAFGMLGSFISLAMSKHMAKKFSGARIIETPATARERWLVETVQRQAGQAGIGMPEVAVFDHPQPNAFATGMNRNNALVAVSRGLLEHMTEDEVEAVLGHEVSHVANGDMITLALIQGVVNTFVIFLSRVIGQMVDRAIFKSRSGIGPGYWITVIIAELVLGILASVIVMYFSRRREFRADQGGAELAGRDKMISALRRLRDLYEPPALPEQLAAFGVSGRHASGLRRLLSSHPPLDERIEALQGA